MSKVTHQPLPYAPNALEPHIDEATMNVHHGKHYATYVTNYNNAVAGTPLENEDLASVLANDLAKVPADKKNAVRNNGGGAFNHALFWKMMTPGGGGKPTGELAAAIDRAFGSFDKFKEEFKAAALGRFGSGWAWLVKDGGSVKITSTPNQDSPVMAGQVPILGLDVWEHAYYLKYQNKRPDYADAFWNVVNWEFCNECFARG